MAEPKRLRNGHIHRSTSLRERMRARYRREGLPCWLCGRPVDYGAGKGEPLSLVVDHVIPLSVGGLDVAENCRPAHYRCNDQKRARGEAPVLRRSATLQ